MRVDCMRLLKKLLRITNLTNPVNDNYLKKKYIKNHDKKVKVINLRDSKISSRLGWQQQVKY